jgi:membrane-associated phospholipid phosphatase
VLKLLPAKLKTTCPLFYGSARFTKPDGEPLVDTLVQTVVAVIVACGISLLVTRYWKISLHLVGMAGVVIVFILLFGPRLFVLSPLVILVGWARWQVRAHTLFQALAGTILAVIVTVATFLLFRI